MAILGTRTFHLPTTRNLNHLDNEYVGDREQEIQLFYLFRPEGVTIPLPSTIGVQRHAELGVEHVFAQDIALREGQANDTLHAIRVHLAEKAVLSRTSVRPARSQSK
jgi:hypothetical protein